MPNWCYTTIKIKGSSEEVKNLHDHIADAISENREENGFGKGWIGNLVIYMGYYWKEFDCRGEICSMELHDDMLEIQTETAWNPCLDIFYEASKKFSPKAELYYVAECPEESWFTTNDPSMKDNYYLEVFDDAYEDYFNQEIPEILMDIDGIMSSDEIRRLIIEAFDFDENTTFEDILHYVSYDLDDEIIHIHALEYEI